MKINEMECDDEVSIKIEYYDNDEKDPLREEPEESFTENNLAKQIEVEQASKTDTNTDNEDDDFCIPESEKTEVNQNHHSWYKEVDNSGSYLCKFCSLKYTTVQTLRYHVKKKHPKEAEVLKGKVIKNKRNRKFKCNICGSYFTAPSNLQEHMNRKHKIGESMSFCHICHAVFDENTQLYVHLRTEHNIFTTKVYVCNICGYQTRKISHFKQHQNTHSDVRSNKCQLCDFTTNHLPNLRIHECIHKVCKPYKCPISECQFTCVARTSLRSHVLKHNSGDKLFHCDKCMYKTNYKQNLKKHSDSHNRNTARIVL